MQEFRSPEVGSRRAHSHFSVERRIAGAATQAGDELAEEVPVALVYNGISHAVMLASPQDLEDFAVGFSLSECIVDRAAEIFDVEVIERSNGIELAVEIATPRALRLGERRRALAGRTGCGLCGTESLAQLNSRKLSVGPGAAIESSAIERAYAELAARQHLFRMTGAVHAAAWCDVRGRVECVREDVGRHNALDKLIGARIGRRRQAAGSAEGAASGSPDGFALVTSRASYEMVQKAAVAGIAVVAAVSAPTGMAVRMAEESGVTLIGFARGDRHNIYSHPERVH